MGRPARYGPTRMFRFRLREEDQDRLIRIRLATSAKTAVDAVRHALLVADARLTNPDPLAKSKESGRAQNPPTTKGSTTLLGSSVLESPAPTPPLEVCPECGEKVKPAWLGVPHKVNGKRCPA